MKKILHIFVIFLNALMFAYPAYSDENGVQVSGEFAPSAYYFDYFEGMEKDKTHFLERYDYRKGFSGDRHSDFYLDANFNFILSDKDRDLLIIERQGFGPYNQRGKLKVNKDKFNLYSSYSYFRTATGGVDYLFNPNNVTGGTDSLYTGTDSGYVRQFNDDSGQSLYKISRTNYSAGFSLKPKLFNNMGSLAVDYDGYTREGNQFARYVLGGSDLRGTNYTYQRWRAYDQQVDENMNKVSFSINLSPEDLFVLTYNLSLEKFDNVAKDTTLGDIATLNGWSYTNPGGGAIYVNGIARANIPLHYIPDTGTTTHSFKFSKNFRDRAIIGAGYGISTFKQDSFTERESTAGYNTGEINTDTGYLQANINASSFLGIGGFLKYYKRNNDSSFPVTGFYDLLTSERLVSPRINSIKSLEYGLEANLYPSALKSTATLGWSHEDKSKDFTFGEGSIATYAYIPPERTLYREDTSSNEAYLKLVSRFAKGITLRITPSYVWANKTGLISEPEEAINVKTSLSYAKPDLRELLVTGFYNVKDKKNNNNTFTGTDNVSYGQNIKGVFNSAGITVSVNPSTKLTTSLIYAWSQDDFDTYYFSSNNRRYEATTIFSVRDTQNYKIDTHTLSLGADYQALSYLTFNGNYSFSNSKGNTASGIAKDELPDIDARINNTLHTLLLGVDYAIKKNISVNANYIYDYYKDEVFSELTGGVNTFIVGLTYKF